MNTQTMKRWAGCLAILLLAAALIPAGAAPAGTDAPPVTNLFGGSLTEAMDTIHSIARVGDDLYIRTDEALFTYTPGDARAVRRADMARVYGAGISSLERKRRPRHPPPCCWATGTGCWGWTLKNRRCIP